MKRSMFGLKTAGVFYALGVLVVVLVILSAAAGRPFYLNPTNLANILDQTAWTGIVAVAMTLLLITGNFDLSVGSVAAFAGAMTMLVLDQVGAPGTIALVFAAGLVFGLINGALVQYVGINAFIVTLGTMTTIRGLVQILTDSRTVIAETTSETLTPIQNSTWAFSNTLVLIIGAIILGLGVLAYVRRGAGNRGLGGILAMVTGAVFLAIGLVFSFSWQMTLPVLYLFVITILAWLFLRFTVFGRRWYAVGGNVEAAKLSGIHTDRYKIAGFCCTAIAASFIGILYGAEIKSVNPGTGLELSVLAAAILGGTSLNGGSGNPIKSVIGALILTTLTNGFNILNLGATYQSFVVGLVIIGAAAIYTASRSDGGRRGGRLGRQRRAGAAAGAAPATAAGGDRPGDTP
jgi:D-xylose transport system permease protein